jgi:hypothetical protein
MGNRQKWLVREVVRLWLREMGQHMACTQSSPCEINTLWCLIWTNTGMSSNAGNKSSYADTRTSVSPLEWRIHKINSDY